MNIGKALKIDVTEQIQVDSEINMSLYQVARWTSLMRGIDVIDEKARQLKIDLDKDKTWVKPLALQKYIDENTPSCVAEIKTLMNDDE